MIATRGPRSTDPDSQSSGPVRMAPHSTGSKPEVCLLRSRQRNSKPVWSPTSYVPGMQMNGACPTCA